MANVVLVFSQKEAILGEGSRVIDAEGRQVIYTRKITDGSEPLVNEEVRWKGDEDHLKNDRPHGDGASAKSRLGDFLRAPKGPF